LFGLPRVGGAVVGGGVLSPAPARRVRAVLASSRVAAIGPGAIGAGVGLPAEAVAVATALLAGVIAKTAERPAVSELKVTAAHLRLAAVRVVTVTLDDALHADLLEFYRDLHRHPELSFQETRTAALITERLRGEGFAVMTVEPACRR